MTDSPRRDVPDPTQPMPYGYSGHVDPAYSNQAPYGSPYQPPPPLNPTQQLPPYSPYGYDPYATEQFGPPYPPGGVPPEPPDPNGRGPRVWLWALAAVSVVIVIGLVIALVIVNSSQQETVVAPPPAPLEPNFSTPSTTTRAPTTTRRTAPSTTPSPTTTAPSGSATPGATETVVYDVDGPGRAINITYVDAGGVLQTEFNVILPWSKEVQLDSPADRSASVSIINVGREISCSITLNGTQIQQRTGSGLTICSALG
jgi:hypothetical protein